MRILFLCVFLLSFGFVHADTDNVEWSDYNLYTDYDSNDEELELVFTVYSDGNPGEDLFLEMEVGDEDCDMDLEYKSFQLRGECTLDIDEEDVRGLYDTSLSVLDEDYDTVYSDGSVEIVVEGYEEEFNWDNLVVDALYLEEDEDLELKIYLENVSREPDYEYEIEFEIDERSFSKDFVYDEDEEELYINFSTRIDENDIEDEYDIDFSVLNTDLDDEKVGSGDLEFEVELISTEDDFNWDDIEYSAIYDEDKERLNLHFFLENIKTEPYGSYESFIEFEDEEYDEKFNYDDDRYRLIAEYSIKISEDDLGNYYDIELIVEDEEEDEVFDDEIDVDVEYLSEADDFDWDELVVTASYDDDSERLYIDLVLEDITSTPTFTYSTDIEFADEEEFAIFSYNSSEDELRATISLRIDEEDIQDEYDIDIEIDNVDEKDEVFDDDIEVEVQDFSIETLSSNSEYDWKNLEGMLTYDSDENKLSIVIELGGIADYPSLDYFGELSVGSFGKISSKLRYDSSNDRLYITYDVYVNSSDLEDEYKLTLFVRDENDVFLYTFVETLEVEFDDSRTAIEKAVGSFIERTYNRFDEKEAAIEYFEKVIVALDAYAERNIQYRSVVNDINNLLRKEINSN